MYEKCGLTFVRLPDRAVRLIKQKTVNGKTFHVFGVDFAEEEWNELIQAVSEIYVPPPPLEPEV